MKSISAGAAALALSICFGGPAMAQGPFHNDRDHDRGAQSRADRQAERHSRRDDRRDHRADRRDDRRDDRYDRRQDRREDRFDRRSEPRHDAHVRPFYAPAPNYHHQAPRVVYGNHHWRGAGPHHDIYRGGRLPHHYRSNHYVVDNWHAHRLSAPPRGYHWVQTGPDFVLAAIATGIILQVFLGG